jgi:hypothetical protein
MKIVSRKCAATFFGNQNQFGILIINWCIRLHFRQNGDDITGKTYRQNSVTTAYSIILLPDSLFPPVLQRFLAVSDISRIDCRFCYFLNDFNSYEWKYHRKNKTEQQVKPIENVYFSFQRDNTHHSNE